MAEREITVVCLMANDHKIQSAQMFSLITSFMCLIPSRLFLTSYLQLMLAEQQ